MISAMCKGLGWGIIIVDTATLTLFRFQNIDMTQLRFSLTYWPNELLLIAGIIIAGYGYARAEEA